MRMEGSTEPHVDVLCVKAVRHRVQVLQLLAHLGCDLVDMLATSFHLIIVVPPGRATFLRLDRSS
jgi:hypothetical protein